MVHNALVQVKNCREEIPAQAGNQVFFEPW